MMVPQLPRGMPQGERMAAEATFVGYFLKLLSHEDRQGKTRSTPEEKLEQIERLRTLASGLLSSSQRRSSDPFPVGEHPRPHDRRLDRRAPTRAR